MQTSSRPMNRSADLPEAWRAGDGVGFRVNVGTDQFECRVTTEVLAGFDFAANDDFDWVATYLQNRDRIDDVARGLIALGLRGPRLLVRVQHFMD